MPAVGRTLYNCTLTGNSAHGLQGRRRGGWVHALQLHPERQLRLRTAAGQVSAILVSTLYNCTLTGNSAQFGGGVALGHGGGAYSGGGAYYGTYNCTLTAELITRREAAGRFSAR